MTPGPAAHMRAVPTLVHGIRGAFHRLGIHWAGLVIVRSRRLDLDQLAGLVEHGRLRPAIDRVLPLSEAASAPTYLETRRARGKVVLRVEPSGG